MFIARVVIPLGNLLLTHRHPDIPSHLLGYSNKGRSPSAGIELKICFSLYYMAKTYKVPVFCFTNMVMSVFFNCISITVYF